MQILCELPEGSGADAEVRFWKVLLQRLGQVPRVPVHIPRSGSGVVLLQVQDQELARMQDQEMTEARLTHEI